LKLSGPLEDYLKAVVDFLNVNPGEFVIFDIQHVRLGDKAFSDLFSYMEAVQSGGYSLTDFVVYDPHSTPLNGLTCGDITQNGAAAGLVILAKTETYEACKHYNYEDSIRSVWHNKIRSGEILAGIEGEYTALKNDLSLDRDKFRVNQAQTTPAFNSFGNALRSIFGWSLLGQAAKHNALFAANADFSDWLSVLPIFMVDFADSGNGDFNKTAIEKINAFNRSL
jgi:hypothetical protein